MEADPKARENRRQVDLHVFGLAPAHGDPRIGWDELEPFRFRDDVDLGFMAEPLTKLEGHRNAADSGAQNNNTRHTSLPCEFLSRPFQASDPVSCVLFAARAP